MKDASVKLPPILESEFRDQVVELARIYRWTVYFTWHSIHSPAGYPDLTLVRPPRLLFAELKTGRRGLTWQQRQWLDLLAECPGVECKIWKPSDWQHIQETLR